MNSDKTRQTNQTQPQQTQEQQAPAQELSDELLEKFQGLKRKLAAAQEREKRSLADYQNLLRRTRQERTKAVKLANQGLITELLPALENLDRAAQQIEDEGLELVVNQLWNILDRFGLEKIEAKGKQFDVETMEVVDQRGEGDQVIEVINNGYRLKDKVIQHAKVVLGSPSKD